MARYCSTEPTIVRRLFRLLLLLGGLYCNMAFSMSVHLVFCCRISKAWSLDTFANVHRFSNSRRQSLISHCPCFNSLILLSIIFSWSPLVNLFSIMLYRPSTSCPSLFMLSPQDGQGCFSASSSRCITNPFAFPPMCTATPWYTSSLEYAFSLAATHNLVFFHQGLNIYRFPSQCPGSGMRESLIVHWFWIIESASQRFETKDFTLDY